MDGYDMNKTTEKLYLIAINEAKKHVEECEASGYHVENDLYELKLKEFYTKLLIDHSISTLFSAGLNGLHVQEILYREFDLKD